MTYYVILGNWEKHPQPWPWIVSVHISRGMAKDYLARANRSPFRCREEKIIYQIEYYKNRNVVGA